MPAGRPFFSSVHVLPPSTDLYGPLPFPPLYISHGRRYTGQNDAYTFRGLTGSMTTSTAPVVSSTNSTFSQVAPPSRVRNSPRS